MATKVCTKCKKKKSIPEFHKSKSTKDGFSCWCADCRRQGQRDWYKKYPEKAKAKERRLRIKREYGITIEQYNEMFNQQQGCCAICGKHLIELNQASLCIDHNHKTSKVRRLLCYSCNFFVGIYETNFSGLQKEIVKYLKEYDG